MRPFGSDVAIKHLNSLGEVTTRAFDDSDKLRSETDPLGHTTSYEYDLYGNRIVARDPSGNTTFSTFDRFGHLLTMLDPNLNAPVPNGVTLRNAYDVQGINLSSTADANGNLTSYTYDNENRLTSVIDSRGNFTTNQYYTSNEAGGRPGDLKAVTIYEKSLTAQAQVQYKVLSATVYTYDANGNQLSQTAKGVTPDRDATTASTYDDENRVIETSDAEQHATRTVYNELDKPLTVTDKMGRQTHYLYDARGNLIETRYPTGAQTPATVTRTVYDEQNRPLYSQDRIQASESVGTATRTIYDPAGGVIRTERVAKVRIGINTTGDFPAAEFVPEPANNTILSSTSTAYDAAGRILSEGERV